MPSVAGSNPAPSPAAFERRRPGGVTSDAVPEPSRLYICSSRTVAVAKAAVLRCLTVIVFGVLWWMIIRARGAALHPFINLSLLEMLVLFLFLLFLLFFRTRRTPRVVDTRLSG